MGTTVQVGRDFGVYWTSGANDVHGLCAHKFASGAKMGLVNVLSYTVEHNTEVYHGAGRRQGWGIKAGAYDLTVHLEGLWLDSGSKAFFQKEVAKTGALAAFAIAFSGTEKGIAFSGCRLGTFEFEVNADGWATETVDIPALVLME